MPSTILGSQAVTMVSDTTANRPTGVAGMQRWNTSNLRMEIYDGSQWRNLAVDVYTVTVLGVAGGGGGTTNGPGPGGGGGGGAGGIVYTTQLVTGGQQFSVTVGTGGSGNACPSQGGTGNNTAFGGSFTALGGGGAGSPGSNPGLPGGSGGGGSGAGGGGSGTSGQGYPGGSEGNGGGGGGAGGAGASDTNGNGGVGVAYSIDGTSRYYAGGGARGPAGSGGAGGGANGVSGPTGNNGTDGYGGGGGNNNAGGNPGGRGGNGVVIVTYPSNTQIGSGGTVTSYTSGTTYQVHKFTSSGTYTG